MTDEKAIVPDRTKSLGGTDIAAICGLSPWKKPIDVYCEKLGLTEAFEGNEQTDWGLRLEDSIARKYADATGFELIKLDPPMVFHPAYPWYSGSPDRMINRQPGGLEIKNVGERQTYKWGEPDSDQVPAYYACQAHWYMPLMAANEYEIKWWDFAALFGGNRFAKYRLMRNPIIEKELFEAGKNFWENHILKQIPPPPDESGAYSKYIERKFPTNLIEAEPATNDDFEVACRLFEIRREIDKLESTKMLHENILKARIGDKAGLIHNHFEITWKKSKDGLKVDWKAVAKEANAPQHIIDNHTEIKDGSRRFIFKFKGE